jgi:hypothetical protein
MNTYGLGDWAWRFVSKVQRRLGFGKAIALDEVGRFLVEKVKQKMSTPAPLNRGALSTAIPGAPLRRVTGAARAGVRYRVVGDHILVMSDARSAPTRKYPQGFAYPVYHESVNHGQPGSGQHPFVGPVFKEYAGEIKRILGRKVHAVLEAK